ncbi:MAG: AI-2E family transporter [Anaerolineales bacterium]|nr:AI-2E family transporter [Anaerolineales bacterium]MCB9127717.1 AI-2E family transporter [Ardenticatenales bacterium]
MDDPIDITSPRWMDTTRMLVGILLIFLLGLTVIKVQSIIAPLILVVVMIFVVRPLAIRVHDFLGVRWGVSLALVYFLLLLVGVLGASELGAALVAQGADLVRLAQEFVANPPDILAQLPFAAWIPQNLNLQTLIQQGIGMLQPVLGSMGTVVGSVFGTAASAIGWLMFVLVVSYFMLLDLQPTTGWSAVKLVPQPYQNDMQQLGQRLSRIWQGFLFGQGLLFLLTVVIVTILLSLLGVPNPLALGLLSGLARFVPYVGPTIVWLLIFIVALTQPDPLFGMSSLFYAILVVVIQFLIDIAFDNIVAPRLFGQVLGVHPAGVLVTAIASVLIIGPVGLLVAAPMLATIIQVGRYLLRKLFDASGKDWTDRYTVSDLLPRERETTETKSAIEARTARLSSRPTPLRTVEERD